MKVRHFLIVVCMVVASVAAYKLTGRISAGTLIFCLCAFINLNVRRITAAINQE